VRDFQFSDRVKEKGGFTEYGFSDVFDNSTRALKLISASVSGKTLECYLFFGQ